MSTQSKLTEELSGELLWPGLKNNKSILPFMVFVAIAIGSFFGARDSPLLANSGFLALRFGVAQTRPTNEAAQSCLEAAKKTLGPEQKFLNADT